MTLFLRGTTDDVTICETAIPYPVTTTGAATATVPANPVGTADVASDDAVTWLHSEAAKGYEGRWVVVRYGTVLADADSPSELPSEVVRLPGAVTVFVFPANSILV